MLELFNALRGFVRAGYPWRMLPNDLPPWTAVESQAKRWMRASCLRSMTHDLRSVIRLLPERTEQPKEVVMDGRALQRPRERRAPVKTATNLKRAARCTCGLGQPRKVNGRL